MKTEREHRADLAADPSDRRHGTRRGAELMCPCPLCAAKRSAINAERRERDRARRAAKAAERREPKPARRPKACTKDVCTVDALLLPMMGKPNVDNAESVCCVCGAPATDRHHVVRRGAGRLVRDGREVAKPTVRLCGDGNASGCHGLAHANRLHFRWVDAVCVSRSSGYVTTGGHWEYLLLGEPTKYQTALNMGGWVPL